MKKYERLRLARKQAAFSSSSEAARAIGVKVSTYASHENGTRDFDDDVASLYARRLRVPVEWLVFERGELKSTPPDGEKGSGLKIRGEVRAGAWLEIEEEPHEYETLPVQPDTRYSFVPQFALAVIGTSMNKVAPPGQYVIVASWPELGTELKDGDLVVVRRERAMTYEATLKRAKRNGENWELWPESTDPRYQEPVLLTDGSGEIEVRVIGKVIGRYEPL